MNGKQMAIATSIFSCIMEEEKKSIEDIINVSTDDSIKTMNLLLGATLGGLLISIITLSSLGLCVTLGMALIGIVICGYHYNRNAKYLKILREEKEKIEMKLRIMEPYVREIEMGYYRDGSLGFFERNSDCNL